MTEYRVEMNNKILMKKNNNSWKMINAAISLFYLL